jgi:hypothetical protein
MVMCNYLQVAKAQQVQALLKLGWSYRRIEAETDLRREIVSRYDAARRANAAKVFAGSPSMRPKCSPARRRLERPADLARSRRGIRLRRQLQIREALRMHARAASPAVGVFHHAPGAEGHGTSFAARRRCTR